MEEYQRWADKEINRLTKENQQLKQFPKKLIIEELNKLKYSVLSFSNGFWRYFIKNGEEYMKSSDLESCLNEYIANRIKELIELNKV